MKIKHFAILATLGVCALVTPAMAQEKGTTPVIVSTVQERMISDEVEALGTLKANESVDLTSTVTELVTKVMFDDGQRVQKGEILVEMDAAEEVRIVAVIGVWARQRRFPAVAEPDGNDPGAEADHRDAEVFIGKFKHDLSLVQRGVIDRRSHPADKHDQVVPA